MAFMKNREKFAKEIMDIACSGSAIAMKRLAEKEDYVL